ncbi:30S ribosomal protein S12 methylthiotransferase RimO [bacterium]|nr:30S ribosomal protein S12 methylthiotransferase RimO [bacterium]
MKKKLFCCSLGCPKNRVDSEIVIAQFVNKGWAVAETSGKADLVILNTCSFINDAREESVNSFFELHGGLKKGAKIAVMGCLPQLYPNLGEMLPEADFIFSVNDIPNIEKIVSAHWNEGYKGKTGKSEFLYTSSMGRVLTYSPWTAYLKIADGCDNFCAYCSIPHIRGRYRERPLKDILAEAENLIKTGVKEIVVIAQDTTQYGSKTNSSLKALIRSLNALKGNFKFRVMYLYPSGIDRELLETIRDCKKMHNYLEVPIQHISSTVLKAMNRRYTERDIYNLIDMIKDVFGKNYLLRTTVISSFPAEKKEDHELLKTFIEKGFFDYIGAFKYSKEESSASFKMRAVVSKTADARFSEIEKATHECMEKSLERFVGKEVEVLYEGIDPELKVPVGRSWNQAPEIDGITIITNLEDEKEGSLLKCRITSIEGTDFIADILK